MALVNKFARLEGLNEEFLAWGNWRVDDKNIIHIDFHLRAAGIDTFGGFETSIEHLLEFRWLLLYTIKYLSAEQFVSNDKRFTMLAEKTRHHQLVVRVTITQERFLNREPIPSAVIICHESAIRRFLDSLAETTSTITIRRDFNLVEFKQQITETIRWCLSHFSADDCKYSLRTPPMFAGYDEGYYDIDDSIQEFAPIVYEKRTKFLQQQPRSNSTNTPLAGGRLALTLLSETTCDGIAPLSTEGFFDVCDLPAWDSWVWYGKTEHLTYLIAWIPEPMLQMVDDSVQESAIESIQWLDQNIFFPHWDLLHAEGLC